MIIVTEQMLSGGLLNNIIKCWNQGDENDEDAIVVRVYGTYCRILSDPALQVMLYYGRSPLNFSLGLHIY